MGDWTSGTPFVRLGEAANLLAGGDSWQMVNADVHSKTSNAERMMLEKSQQQNRGQVRWIVEKRADAIPGRRSYSMRC